MPTNEEKASVWQAYRDGKPVRVPVSISANPRVVILDPRWNDSGVTFADYFTSAAGVIGRARVILQSGIMQGGRFILHEANNLPPACPEENLRAMYHCCLEHGGYPAGGD